MMIEVKVCDNCKHRNPVTALECEVCGLDLTFTYPQKIDDSVASERDSEGSKAPQGEMLTSKTGWALCIPTEDDRWEIISEEVSVGRDCELCKDRFNSSNYTSRIHAKLRVLNDKLQIMDASTNGTFINDRRIPKMEWTDVDEESTIKFADVSFIVRKK